MRERRDPRAERARHAMAVGGRVRIDRTGSTPPPNPPPQAGEGYTSPSPEKRGRAGEGVLQPAFLIAVVSDHPASSLSAWDRQLLGAARLLAGSDGGVVLLTTDSADPGTRAATIAAIVEEVKPRHTIFAESQAGGDLARRVAALTGAALFPGVEMVTPHSVVRPCHAGIREQAIAPGAMISLAADVVAEYAGPTYETRSPTEEANPAFTRIGPPMRDPASTPLAEADFVVAAGNGITDFRSFKALVAALDATPGASRAVCDAGDMPRDRQVGASGTVLGGSCYMALGIAGAPQHLQGIGKVEHVIAVNTDLHAAMVKRAGLAIIADAQQVMPALLRLVDA